MTDLTAFMSHLYSEIPSVSEPFSGLYRNLEVVLAKGSVSAFQGSPCVVHFWSTQPHANKISVCAKQICILHGMTAVLQS